MTFPCKSFMLYSNCGKRDCSSVVIYLFIYSVGMHVLLQSLQIRLLKKKDFHSYSKFSFNGDCIGLFQQTAQRTKVVHTDALRTAFCNHLIHFIEMN